ncbi:MAG: carbon-nitrogen hydrolase family protein [Gammaproteobacteria bacterium]|nr:carbon-nitrogen hydrolase family protein [Gammaproteobacteria bacterium]
MSKVAAIQMASGPQVNANLAEAKRLIKDAAEQGAELVVLPENFAIIGQSEADKVDERENEGDGPIQDFLAAQAKQQGVWIVGGTIPLASEDDGKVTATCLLYNDKGEQVSRYDKIHLFDVQLPGSDEQYVESETISPGDSIVVVDTPFGKLGLAVCYDLRFPELFREMLNQGVEIITLPSAFTALTGKAHWETLLRARAIENLCFFVAAGHGGFHFSGRETHGHSMIIDPWGVILEEKTRGNGVAVSDIDLMRLKGIRERFPVLDHRRLQCGLT